jgi:iron complex transport system ATP-binding protein
LSTAPGAAAGAARSGQATPGRRRHRARWHLILDEPTNHLDIRYQTDILEIVSALGITVLAAIHDLSLAALFCDTVHLAGQIIAGGPPGSVITAEMVQYAYGTDVLVIEHPETGTPHLIPRRLPGAGSSSSGNADSAVPERHR